MNRDLLMKLEFDTDKLYNDVPEEYRNYYLYTDLFIKIASMFFSVSNEFKIFNGNYLAIINYIYNGDVSGVTVDHMMKMSSILDEIWVQVENYFANPFACAEWLSETYFDGNYQYDPRSIEDIEDFINNTQYSLLREEFLSFIYERSG